MRLTSAAGPVMSAIPAPAHAAQESRGACTRSSASVSASEQA
eukprot:CAMPEP_0202066374 /NCGR_PEP_ID=MMETSP0963-20130614/53798_1 /ASSEMBLY_ACC=CAM_ASM_000494 /TAXON_ID=4773 /ORGANISM="Schizochytrium aggregatum, Strain ATCC28209" /LENGTH=41 /DNA_ID= /DNA_START= /DNA_END= /DNA_ORIENTATION=